MAIACTVYIDETGDLGANRGTRWFVLSAVIVDKDCEGDIRNALYSIKAKFNYRTIHWRKIGEFNRKAYISSELSKYPFTYVNVLFDTTQYDPTKISSPDIEYNYLCKLLLERVSWYMHDTDRVGEIILSSRGTSKDATLIDYIKNRLLNYPHNNIEKTVFTNVTAKAASSWDMLQLADVCATSMFNWHEPDWLGFITPCHAMKFKNKLFRQNGKIQTYGIKYFSDKMKPSTDFFTEKKFCAKGRGTPSATTT